MKLIASGCSFTDANYNNTTWKKWPDLIEGNWNKVINTGESGLGNGEIIRKVKNEILLKRPSVQLQPPTTKVPIICPYDFP